MERGGPKGKISEILKFPADNSPGIIHGNKISQWIGILHPVDYRLEYTYLMESRQANVNGGK